MIKQLRIFFYLLEDLDFPHYYEEGFLLFLQEFYVLQSKIVYRSKISPIVTTVANACRCEIRSQLYSRQFCMIRTFTPFLSFSAYFQNLIIGFHSKLQNYATETLPIFCIVRSVFYLEIAAKSRCWTGMCFFLAFIDINALIVFKFFTISYRLLY